MIHGSSLHRRSAISTAFEIYLRTGRRLSPDQIANEIEVKFNPWHDPEDGRFTYEGRGRYSPGGGRAGNGTHKTHSTGGQFGGGGASGSWSPSPKPSKPTANSAPKRTTPSSAAPKPVPKSETGQSSPDARRNQAVSSISLSQQGRPKVQQATRPASETPHKHIERNGYDYEIDDKDRTRHVEGEIRAAQPEQRSRRIQTQVGKPDRRDTDDGGHYIAARFGGPREAFNHFAQDSNFNRGKYRTIEDSWAKNVRSGRRVFVELTPHYHGSSKRPYSLDVIWYVDGEFHEEKLPNEKRGK